MTDNYHQTIANLEKRIAALEEDNALMKSDLGLVHDQDRIGMFVGVLHIPPQAARLLITLMDCNGRLLNRDYIWQSLPHPNAGEAPVPRPRAPPGARLRLFLARRHPARSAPPPGAARPPRGPRGARCFFQ